MVDLTLSEVSTGKTANGDSIHLISLHGQSISTKLDDANYMLWKQQVLATIEGFGLEKFIYGSRSILDKFIPGKSGVDDVVNPDYVSWRRQDQLITSWLLSSMSEGVLIGVVGLATSKDIWDTMAANFASQSRAKLMQLKFQLQTLKKGAQSMKDYLNKVKNCCDILASAGECVTEDNQILHILTGLGQEYNAVMVSLTSRVEPCSLREVKSLLLSYENRLEMVESTNLSMDGSSPSANIASHTQSNGGRGPSNRDRWQFNNNRRGGRGNNSRGRGGRFNNYKPRCQIYKILCHTADRCYERLNPNFVPDQTNHGGYNGHRNSSTSSSGGSHNGGSDNMGYNPSANIANMGARSLNGSSELNWYPDS